MFIIPTNDVSGNISESIMDVILISDGLSLTTVTSSLLTVFIFVPLSG